MLNEVLEKCWQGIQRLSKNDLTPLLVVYLNLCPINDNTIQKVRCTQKMYRKFCMIEDSHCVDLSK